MYYFASDMHLGLGSPEQVRARERVFVDWLKRVSADADAIFIAGDMFDFWYEYKRVIPKGFSRLLGTLSALTDSGVKIHFFPGNHDLWAYDYLQTECGVEVHHKPGIFDLYGKRVFITHGDDIHARTHFWARIMNGIFRSRVARWLFSHFIHPNSALRFGHAWSSGSRKAKSIAHTFLGEKEPMVQFARRYTANAIDYFIFGHNHCAEVYPLGDNKPTAVFLGEWIENPTYAVMDSAGTISLKKVTV
jgi:UDP-2,3-diacylglucosamine hydrolase